MLQPSAPAPPPYNEAPPSYDAITAPTQPRPAVAQPPPVPHVDIRHDIVALQDTIQAMSSSLAEEQKDFKDATSTLTSRYDKISTNLDVWKRHVTQQIEENYRKYKAHLQRVHDTEKERLTKGHEKTKSTLETSEKLMHIAKHLRRTGNPRDLQHLKDNMTENIDTLNLLLDQSSQLKRSVAETWDYVQPNLAPDTFTYLLGKLTVKTANLPQATGQSSVNEQSRISEHEEKSVDDSSIENLMTKVVSAQLEGRYMLMHTFSSKTYNDKARCHPMAFTLDWMGNIVVADKYNNKVKIFTERGQLVREITSQYLRSPSGVTMTPEGNIAVSDSQMSDVKVFNSNGDLLFYYQRAMSPGGVAFNKQGDLVVADCGMKAVLIYDNRNWGHPRRILRDVTMPGTFPNRSTMLYPHYVAVNSMDDIFVSDRTAKSIHLFDKEGNAIQGFGERYSMVKRFQEPYGVTVDKTDNILIADYGSNTVVTIGADNQYKPSILDKGHDLKFPTNIVVSTEGKLLVSEYLSGDIKVFGTQELIDTVAEEEAPELPPAYDALGASAPAYPSVPSSGPDYQVYANQNPETTI